MVGGRGPDGGLSEILCLSPWAGTSRSPVPVCSSLLQARTEWCTCETAREAVHARQGEPFVGGQACALFGRSDTRGRISQAGNQRSRSGVWDDHSSASVWLQHAAHGFQLRDVEIRDVGKTNVSRSNEKQLWARIECMLREQMFGLDILTAVREGFVVSPSPCLTSPLIFPLLHAFLCISL
ncbi:hypothetical protein RRG08_010236 [Elysia crispata]|uniref:Uncharacterized protein n=1 Tax=Elysia crispata TaxID=231223 RepID=A0AAE0Z090_9GAST|nr:hypothetical protein RRG08_010236 [Elysia crispata]